MTLHRTWRVIALNVESDAFSSFFSFPCTARCALHLHSVKYCARHQDGVNPVGTTKSVCTIFLCPVHAHALCSVPVCLCPFGVSPRQGTLGQAP